MALSFVCDCGREVAVMVEGRRRGQHVLSQPEGVPASGPRARLSPVERRVLPLVALGETDQGIADELGLSLHVVKHAVRSAMLHLSARNRTDAVIKAGLSASLRLGDESSV